MIRDQLYGIHDDQIATNDYLWLIPFRLILMMTISFIATIYPFKLYYLCYAQIKCFLEQKHRTEVVLIRITLR